MLKNLFQDKSIVIFDIEVIDFAIEAAVMVQFAARKYVGNEMVDKLNLIIRHKPIELPADFVARTRINETMVKKQGVSLADAKQQILDFIGDLPLISYKGNYFYFPLLWKVFNNQIKNRTIDIIDIATALKLFDNPDEVSLEEFALGMDLPFDNHKWHNASYDVSVIEKIWFKLKALALKHLQDNN